MGLIFTTERCFIFALNMFTPTHKSIENFLIYLCILCQQITHPAGCFPQFIKFFGEHIFVLWKFVLLQKRILFFSPPPVGVSCYRGMEMENISLT